MSISMMVDGALVGETWIGRGSFGGVLDEEGGERFVVVVLRSGGREEGADGGVFSEFGVWVGVFSRGFFFVVYRDPVIWSPGAFGTVFHEMASCLARVTDR